MFEAHHQSRQVARANYLRMRMLSAPDGEHQFWRQRMNLHRALARTPSCHADVIGSLVVLCDGNPALVPFLKNLHGSSPARGGGSMDGPAAPL